jgi:hypothetical protein
MLSTAIYPNRVKDKGAITIPEFPGDKVSIYTKDTHTLVATGYVRVVFGDHGPYVEMRPDQIVTSNFSKKRVKCDMAYYDEAYCIHSLCHNRPIMLYYQRRDVKNLPNPPAGRVSFRGNRKDMLTMYPVWYI